MSVILRQVLAAMPDQGSDSGSACEALMILLGHDGCPTVVACTTLAQQAPGCVSRMLPCESRQIRFDSIGELTVRHAHSDINGRTDMVSEAWIVRADMCT